MSEDAQIRVVGTDELAALRRLVEVEGVDVERLAIRAAWPVERVAAVVDGDQPVTDLDVTHLLACFGISADLEPLDAAFVEERDRARDWTPTQRLAAAAELSKFATELHAEGHRLRRASEG